MKVYRIEAKWSDGTHIVYSYDKRSDALAKLVTCWFDDVDVLHYSVFDERADKIHEAVEVLGDVQVLHARSD